ncbi:MAG: alcohol dehydrogenase catalytic domain-containing protein [Oscillospiraceae bacterium]
MRAAVFENVGVLTVKEVPYPEIRKADDVIIEIELCSICGTDVHIMSNPPGYSATPNTILGHEIVGKIVEVGDGVSTVKIGDRVVLNPNDYCGKCRYCKANMPNFCEHIEAMGIDVDGGFAEYVRTSEKVVYKISDTLDARLAGFAEPLACILNAAGKIRVQPGESVVIIGAGTIGLMFAQLVKSAGAYPVIISEPSELRRDFAKKCGADYVVNPLETNLEEFVMEKTGFGSDFAIDMVGSQMVSAIELVKKGGTVIVFGVNAKARAEVSQSRITQREVDVKGTWIANATFPKAVNLLESGVLNLDILVTHVLPLEQISEGIELLRKGAGVEIYIDPKMR